MPQKKTRKTRPTKIVVSKGPNRALQILVRGPVPSMDEVQAESVALRMGLGQVLADLVVHVAETVKVTGDQLKLANRLVAKIDG